jgi:hypothetical protein
MDPIQILINGQKQTVRQEPYDGRLEIYQDGEWQPCSMMEILVSLAKDAERLSWIESNLADVDAPTPGEESTWIIYTPEKQFASGSGCSRNLRKAIDIAMKGQSGKNLQIVNLHSP